ncbi:MAG: zinc metallopeptidase, partial [bacterium]
MNLDYLTIVLIILIIALVYYLLSRFTYNYYLKRKNFRNYDGRNISSEIISGESLTITLSVSHKDYQSYIDTPNSKLVLSHKILNEASITSLAIVSFELSLAKAFSSIKILWIIKQIVNTITLLFSSISTLLIFLSLILNDSSMYNL